MPPSSKSSGRRPGCCLLAFALTAILSLGSPASLGAVAAGKFAITGNRAVSRTVLADAIERVGCPNLDSTCVEAACRALAEAYWARGYLGVEVNCKRASASSDTVSVTIAEGPASLLSAIKLEGLPAEDRADLEGLFVPPRGAPFSQGDIESAIDQVLTYYDSRGYPLARIVPEVRVLAGDSIEVLLGVDRGPKARLGGVRFRGLKKTHPSVALRESGLRPGEPYDGRRIDDAGAKLSRLGIFEEVSEPELSFEPRDTTVTVAFDVTEAHTSTLEGLMAYAPTAGHSKLVGSLNFEMLNLGGRLRRVRATWARKGNDRLTWSLYYREPRLFGKPFALETSLASDVIDTSYALRKFWLGLVFLGEGGVELGAGGSIGATKDRTAAGGEGNFSERGLSFYLRREGRLRPLNPQGGSYLEVSHEVESLRSSEGATRRRTLSSLKVDTQYILSLGQRTNLAMGGRFQGVFPSSGQVPASHQIRLGGMTSLRGYPEEWFTVSKAAVVTLEARWLLGPYSRIYGFADAATLENAIYKFGDLAGFPFGYGLGMMAETSAGIVRLEIALGRGDTWSDAKLHLGLVERF
ncbi:MAG TPA: POTRA domain-containing protein [bacterium]|nr:POTRA domain-containing protein [bacterium]